MLTCGLRRRDRISSTLHQLGADEPGSAVVGCGHLRGRRLCHRKPRRHWCECIQEGYHPAHGKIPERIGAQFSVIYPRRMPVAAPRTSSRRLLDWYWSLMTLRLVKMRPPKLKTYMATSPSRISAWQSVVGIVS